MSDGKVKPWPEPLEFDADFEDMLRYERARAEAWESRCRYLVAELNRFVILHDDLSAALKHIGPLPPTLPEETKGE